jgi:homoserine kinase type II
MQTVFVVHHVHEFDDDREDVKLIGIYSSRENAEAAVARLRSQPGFRDLPQGFSVEAYEVDRDH